MIHSQASAQRGCKELQDFKRAIACHSLCDCNPTGAAICIMHIGLLSVVCKEKRSWKVLGREGSTCRMVSVWQAQRQRLQVRQPQQQRVYGVFGMTKVQVRQLRQAGQALHVCSIKECRAMCEA